jgi:hypothetical protein
MTSAHAEFPADHVRRVARVTEYIGRGDGGLYVEEPDIPEGLTCQDWRQRRAQARRAERRERPRSFSWPALRRPSIPRPTIQPGSAFPTPAFGEKP